jgi:hypothetical protein
MRSAEIVHDDLAPAAAEQQRVGAAEAVAGARDDRDAVVEAELAHDRSSSTRPGESVGV